MTDTQIQIPNIRRLALQALSDINRGGAYANVVLKQYISKYGLGDLDRRFFTELVYGVIRRRNYLDAIIEYLTKKKIKKLSSLVVEILRLGLYQMIYMDKVPNSAAVNESVKLAKKMTRGLSGFVNGVLRNADRQAESLTIDDLAKTPIDRIAYTYNQPTWLVDYWCQQMGTEATEELCAWFNEKPYLSARINTLKTDVEGCIKELEAAGWILSRDQDLDDLIYIDKHLGSLEASKFVKEGYITFMDKASLMVGRVVNPRPGERVLDTCAAPGGKTMHMASLMRNEGTLLACDVYDHKLALMKDNAKRLGVTIVKTCLQDGREIPESQAGSYDRVLVDAPCSGLGILQKKLDMRWRKEPSSLTDLPKLQAAILDRAAMTVKEGGILVYSTCTINSLENQEVVKTFLKNHKEFRLDPIGPDELPVAPVDGMVTVNPARHDMDGFFMARMRKEKA